jgi:hypothetical protein
MAEFDSESLSGFSPEAHFQTEQTFDQTQSSGFIPMEV